MTRTRIAQVKDFNAIVDVAGMDKAYWMTTSTGSIHEPLRQRGWVLFQSPKLGDDADFARWYPNRKEAELHLKAMA